MGREARRGTKEERGDTRQHSDRYNHCRVLLITFLKDSAGEEEEEEEDEGGAGGPCLVVVLGSAVSDSFSLPMSPSLVAGLELPERGSDKSPRLPTPFSRGTCWPRLQFCNEDAHMSQHITEAQLQILVLHTLYTMLSSWKYLSRMA